MSQLAVGGNWTTIVTLVNTQPGTVNVTLNFIDDRGAPLQVNIETYGPFQNFSVDLPPNGSRRLTLLGQNNTTVGWIRVVTPDKSGASVSAVFRQSVPGRPDFEAVVPAIMALPQYRIAFDETKGYTTGLALCNPSEIPAIFEITVRGEDGKKINQTPIAINLPAYGHRSFALGSGDEPALDDIVKDNKGVLDVVATTSRAVAVLGLRFSPSNSFTTVPALPFVAVP